MRCRLHGGHRFVQRRSLRFPGPYNLVGLCSVILKDQHAYYERVAHAPCWSAAFLSPSSGGGGIALRSWLVLTRELLPAMLACIHRPPSMATLRMHSGCTGPRHVVSVR